MSDINKKLAALVASGKISETSLVKAAAFKSELEKRALNSVETILAAGAFGAGMVAANKGIDVLEERSMYKNREKFLSDIYSAHPNLRNEDPIMVERYLTSLMTFSPVMAKDPLAAGAFITQSLKMADLGGPPVGMYKDLTSIYKQHSEGKDKARKSPGKTFMEPVKEVFTSGMKEEGKNVFK